MQLEKFRRERFAALPTPLQEMPRLTRKLGGPRLFIKRDDLTGLAFGGNKTRKLEFIMADAKYKKADVIVTGAGLQSNWCTQTMAAAQRCGMNTVICSSGPVDGYKPEDYGGNMLLHYLLGADVRVFPVSFEELHEHVFAQVADALKAEGHTPYIAEYAGSTPLGTLGYVNAMLELSNQAAHREVEIDYVLTACGTGGTQAGLLLGAKALNTNIKVIGIAVTPFDNTQYVQRLVKETATLLRVPLTLNSRELTIFHDYVGDGYGAISKEVVDAIQLVAQTEGIILDPVYTGKAMAGLIDLIQNKSFTPNDTVVFVHTGGTPALFAYNAPITSIMELKVTPWRKPPWAYAPMK